MVYVKTDKDGLLSNNIKAIRYAGRYDPDAPDKKKFDLATYDVPTLMGILGRLSGATYITNPEKRLPKNRVFSLQLRVIRKAKDNSLGVSFKSISYKEKNKKGRIVDVELDKKDPDYRKIRKASRTLPAAFKNTINPPKRTRGKVVEKEDEDD